MTPKEFAEGFIPEFRACLPQLAKSLKEQPEYKETLKRWRDALSSVPFADTKTVLNRIVEGDLPRPFLDNVAADIKKECIKLARARQFASSIPQSSGREPRYTCHKCRDSGRASIVHTKVLTDLKKGIAPKFRKTIHGEEVPIIPEMAVPCSCDRGIAMAQGRTIGGKTYAAIPHLGQRSWHIFRRGNPNEDLAAAKAWVEKQGDRVAAA